MGALIDTEKGSIKIRWPNKDEREKYEIYGFISVYTQLNPHLNLIVETKKECPDYIIRDQATDKRFGVELTSVYLDDRSVPDVHKKTITGVTDIPYNSSQINIYQERLIEAINTKVSKARKGYDIDATLILSVYVNEYISIYTEKEDWDAFVRKNENVLDAINPFSEIVLWNLPDDGVFSIIPNGTT